MQYNSMNKKLIRNISLLLVPGFLVRVGYISIQSDEPLDRKTDAPSYVSIASNIISGRGFIDSSGNLSDEFPGTEPTSFWAPVYPLYLSALFLIGGTSNFTPVKISQAFLSVATGFLAFILGRRLFDSRVAMLGLGLYIYYPHAIYYSNTLGTETLFSFMVMLWSLLVYRFVDQPGLINSLMLGCVSGLGFLTNPVLLSFFSSFLVFIYCNRFFSRKILVRLVLVFVSFLIVISPWLARNLLVHRQIVFVPTKSGFNLLIGNNPEANGTYMRLPIQYESRFAGLGEVEKDRKARSLAVEWIRENPDTFLALAGNKVYRLWTPYPNVERRLELIVVQLMSYGLVLAGALSAIFLYRDKWRRLSLPYLMFAVQSIVAAVYFGAGRFRFPLDGLLVLMASASFLYFLDRLKRL